jgi:hypothetical protein
LPRSRTTWRPPDSNFHLPSAQSIEKLKSLQISRFIFKSLKHFHENHFNIF